MVHPPTHLYAIAIRGHKMGSVPAPALSAKSKTSSCVHPATSWLVSLGNSLKLPEPVFFIISQRMSGSQWEHVGAWTGYSLCLECSCRPRLSPPQGPCGAQSVGAMGYAEACLHSAPQEVLAISPSTLVDGAVSPATFLTHNPATRDISTGPYSSNFVGI